MPNHEVWRFTWPPCFLTRRHVQKCGGDATPEGDADHATTGKQGRQERRDRAHASPILRLHLGCFDQLQQLQFLLYARR